MRSKAEILKIIRNFFMINEEKNIKILEIYILPQMSEKIVVVEVKLLQNYFFSKT